MGGGGVYEGNAPKLGLALRSNHVHNMTGSWLTAKLGDRPERAIIPATRKDNRLGGMIC